MDERRAAALSIVWSAFLPPVLLVQAWASSSSRIKHWLLTIFFVFYGSTIAIAHDPMGAGPDGVRHLLAVRSHYVGMSIDVFLEQLWLILTFRGNLTPSPDVYKHVLSFFVGGVLQTPKLFFPIVAGIYGYFFAGSMLIIFRRFSLKHCNLIILGLALVFFLIKNIEGVNTVRTWTGLWILVYSCLRYFESKNKKYLLLMAVPPFVHFGYFIMAIPAWMVVLFGPKQRLYAMLFIGSSVTTLINPTVVTNIIETTELGENRVRAYLVEDPLDSKRLQFLGENRGLRWYAKLQRLGFQKWGLNILVYVSVITGLYIFSMNRVQQCLFSIGLLTLTLSNSSWFLSTLSHRSWLVGAIFVLAAFLMARLDPIMRNRFPYRNPLYRYGVLTSVALLSPYLIYNLSTIFDYPSVYLLALPFLAFLEPEYNPSLKEVLQFVFQWLL